MRIGRGTRMNRSRSRRVRESAWRGAYVVRHEIPGGEHEIVRSIRKIPLSPPATFIVLLV